MRIFLLFLLFLSLAESKITPIVIYHGLGDSCCSSNMMRLVSRIKEALPGVFIHSVMIGKGPEDDRKRSLLDNMNRQIAEVCDKLARIPELSEGFNAIGLSQGGQFLRAYVERCNNPPVRKLITLGSQHQGVMALPGCIEPNSPADSTAGVLSIEEVEAAHKPRRNLMEIFTSSDRNPGSSKEWFRNSFIGQIFALFQSDENCSWWKRLLKLGVYSPVVRSEVVQAQYFKDPQHLSAYFEHNQFLLDINNDHPDPRRHNQTYAKNLASLTAFYMYIFEEDTVVVPKESGWFALHDPKTAQIKFLKELSVYNEDRLGLKRLDREGKLFFRKLPGEHLKLSNNFISGELADILRD